MQFFLQPPDLAQNPAAVIEKLQSGACQPYPTRQAHEKRSSQLPFDAANMPAQCGLRDAEMFRGTRDATQFRNLDEVLDAAQIHTPSRCRGLVSPAQVPPVPLR
jgi:hypothetical protein